MKYIFTLIFVLGLLKTSVFSQSKIIWKFFDGNIMSKNVIYEGGSRLVWEFYQTKNVNLGIDEAKRDSSIVLDYKELFQISINNNEIILSEDDFSKGIKDKVLYKLTSTKCYYKKQNEKNWVLFRDGNFIDGYGLTNSNIKENTDVIESYKKLNNPLPVTQKTSAKNKSVVSKTKPKKVPTTRKCECCGIVFKIVNGWGYQNSLGNVKVFQFGEPDELALDILTTKIGTSMGYSEDEIGYHSYIIYHSKRCAYDCGN